MPHIVIVDDDAAIAQLVSDSLEDEGYSTAVLSCGERAVEYIMSHTDIISLIILDIMMPDKSGLEVCNTVRSEVSCPIIFLTAKHNTADTVLGLELGADDYITKPFVVEELVARVKAHLRREKRASDEQDSPVIKIGEIEIDVGALTVKKSGEKIPFSTREFQLLEYLMKNAGKVLTREQIFNHVWGPGIGDMGTVAVNVKNVRDKIDPDSEYIKTIWGVGYKFIKF